MCQRVMDAGDDGHILVSSTALGLIGQIRDWEMQPLGEVEVKHGVTMRLFNLCTEGVGNTELPEKVAEARGEAPEAPAPAAPKPAVPTPAAPAKPKVATIKLVLPDGFTWVSGEPPEDCPLADVEAYHDWVAEKAPVSIRNEAGGVELVWVPPGRLLMGSGRGRDDEKPVLRKTIENGYWFGRAPVTVTQWQRVMGSVPPPYNDKGGQHPVVGVTWDECREFCRRARLAMPPEHYWEFAARGREGRVYPWGNSWDASLCQSKEKLGGREGTAPAGVLAANASWCGALDMAGNVWEWCSDWYSPTLLEGAAPPSGRRSLRGGAWASDDFECRTSCRLSSAPNNRSPLIGFRPARPNA